MTDKYVLITPAKNEEENIDNLVQTVVSQTIQPFKWLIVSNGSTDRTEELVNNYAPRYPFIQLIKFDHLKQRDFAVKVSAINDAYQMIQHFCFQYIGTLDADIILDANYYEHILTRFIENPKLGIAGGMILEKENGSYKNRFGNTELYVPGSIQLFRKECFEKIGGYIPMKYGGEDMVADEMARMYGWTVQSFPEYHVLHNRRTGANDSSAWHSFYRAGLANYYMGYHPLYEIAKIIRRIAEKPYLFGSLVRLMGYLNALIRREELILSHDLIHYIRQQQLQRLKATISIRKGS